MSAKRQVLLSNHDCEDRYLLLLEARWRIPAKVHSREFAPYRDPETASKYEHAIVSSRTLPLNVIGKEAQSHWMT